MNKTILAGLAGVLISSMPAIAAPPPSTQAVADGTSHLGFNLFANLSKPDAKQNFLISPLSIEECVALLYNGARGETEQKVASTMGLGDLSQADVNSGFADFNNHLTTADPDVQIDIANALWPDKHVKLNAGYVERCRKSLGATVEALDYGAPETAAKKINAWVDENTKHNITELVGPDDVQHASVVLTNAVYFHGKWTVPFEKAATVNGAFQVPDDPKDVPMMHRSGEMEYVKDPGYQAVSLSYGNGSLRMLVALPKEGDDVASMATGAWFDDAVGRLRSIRLALSMPRFKADCSTSLLKPMDDLGLPLSGDYSGIGAGEQRVSQIVHKATVDVDEAGTVATAATGIVTTRAMILDNNTMTVDRPFFFAIYDQSTKAVLFSGVIRDPS